MGPDLECMIEDIFANDRKVELSRSRNGVYKCVMLNEGGTTSLSFYSDESIWDAVRQAWQVLFG